MDREDILDPFAEKINLENGEIEDSSGHWTRRLSDMRDMYQDQEAVENILEEKDPVIYEVYEISVPEESGHLIHCTSIIYPGKIGREYYMTKGHYHEKRGTAESYLCLSGEGYLLTQTENGDSASVGMERGSLAYIPPYWAHRTVNTGDKPFVFFGVYPAAAGHDYGSIEEVRFPEILVEQGGEPILKPNPEYEI